MHLRSGTVIEYPNKKAQKKGSTKPQATSAPPKKPELPARTAMLVERLQATGLVDKEHWPPLFDGQQALRYFPKSVPLPPKLALSYAPSLAFQYMAWLELAHNRSLVGAQRWHLLLDDCLNLINESPDARDRPELYELALRCANAIVDEANKGSPYPFWQHFTAPPQFNPPPSGPDSIPQGHPVFLPIEQATDSLQLSVLHSPSSHAQLQIRQQLQRQYQYQLQQQQQLLPHHRPFQRQTLQQPTQASHQSQASASVHHLAPIGSFPPPGRLPSATQPDRTASAQPQQSSPNPEKPVPSTAANKRTAEKAFGVQAGDGSDDWKRLQKHALELFKTRLHGYGPSNTSPPYADSYEPGVMLIHVRAILKDTYWTRSLPPEYSGTRPHGLQLPADFPALPDEVGHTLRLMLGILLGVREKLAQGAHKVHAYDTHCVINLEACLTATALLEELSEPQRVALARWISQQLLRPVIQHFHDTFAFLHAGDQPSQ